MDKGSEEPVEIVSKEIHIAGGMAKAKVSEVTKIVETGEGLGRKTIVTGPFYCAGGGHQLKVEKSVRCHHCNSLVCDECSIKYGANNQEHCEECFRRDHYDLSLSDYLFLLCIEKDIDKRGHILEITGIPEQEIEDKFELLQDYLLAGRGLFGFSEGVRLNHRGKDAMSVYDRVYGEEDIAIEIKEILRRWIIEKKVK